MHKRRLRRYAAFSFLLFIILSGTGLSQKEIAIHYFRPYSYNAAGNYIRAWLDPRETGESFTLFLDGKKISCLKGDSGRIEVQLPLAGSVEELVIRSDSLSGNKVLARQLFRPLVPSDWGYFSKGTVSIICSSHQDIAWMNTPDSCREQRIHDIIIPALDLIDKDPGYRFEMEQSLNLMEVLDALPGEKQRLMNAYKNGQFTWGATFNQPYEGLESDEQLVRQVYLGRKWIKDNLPGMDALTAYNVDVPGRTLQSPQIFEKAGIKYLFVSRMKEGFCNWYSPDGSRILTFSPGNYGWALLVYQYFEHDAVTALRKLHSVLENWNNYYETRHIPPDYAVIISTDAGGPRDYSRIIDEWNEIAGASGFGIPVLRQSTADEFLNRIDVPGIKIDSISGERPDLWLYIHGPAHYEAIKAKKAASVSLPAAEIFSSINGMVKGSLKGYPASGLAKGWYESIYPDHGWGGNHGDITDSIFRADLEAGNAAGEQIIGEALQELSSEVRLRNPNSILIYNDLSWMRNSIVNLDISSKKGPEWMVTDTKGKTVPSELITNGTAKSIIFEAENIPSMGYKTYLLKKGTTGSDDGYKAGADFYENSFYSVWLGAGGIRRLYDKELKKQIFNTARYAGGDLLSLEYRGNGAGEFIQIMPAGFDGFETFGSKDAPWSLKENGPVSAKFESVATIRNFKVIQSIIIYHHIKRIDFEYDIPDWPGEHNRQLRVAFPLDMSDPQITYDVPMGIVNVGKDELKTAPGGWSWEGTYSQKPDEIHPREIENFISASDRMAGVTISTNIAVADWIDPGRESAVYPVLQGILLSSHKSCHYLGNWYEQKGHHHFRFSLTTHLPGWKNGYHFGVEGNHPVYSLLKEKTQSGTLPEELSFISVTSPFVRITALKKSESGSSLIIRMVEMGGNDEHPDLNLYFPVRNFFHTNLIEEEEKDTGQRGKVLKPDLGKNSIETFKMDLQ